MSNNENKDDVRLQEAVDQYKKLKQAAVRIFVDNPDGKLIMKHLSSLCFEYDTTAQPLKDGSICPYRTAVAEGQRLIYMNLKRLIEKEIDEIEIKNYMKSYLDFDLELPNLRS